MEQGPAQISGSNAGKWRHAPDSPFGTDLRTYVLAMAWLDGHGLIEDRGCGPARAKRFVMQSPYRGVDGSPGYADVVADLVTYRAPVDCILLRHVIEHDERWAEILSNAVADFQKRLCLVLFTPLVETTQVIARSEACAWWDAGIPDISFARADILTHVAPYLRGEETVFTPGGYGAEHLFYLEKPCGN